MDLDQLAAHDRAHVFRVKEVVPTVSKRFPVREIDYAKNAYAYAPRELAGGDSCLDSEGKDDMSPTIYDVPTIDAPSSSGANPGGAAAPSSGDTAEPKVDNVIPEEGD